MLDDAFEKSEVLQFLGHRVGRYGIDANSKAKLEERIRTLNPHFSDSGAYWGDILLHRELPPYEADGNHHYRAGY